MVEDVQKAGDKLRIGGGEVWFESPFGIFVLKQSHVYVDEIERTFSELNNQPIFLLFF